MAGDEASGDQRGEGGTGWGVTLADQDTDKADACYAVPRVKATFHVTLDELRAALVNAKWKPAAIDLLFKDNYVPERVRLGTTMLVIRK